MIELVSVWDILEIVCSRARLCRKILHYHLLLIFFFLKVESSALLMKKKRSKPFVVPFFFLVPFFFTLQEKFTRSIYSLILIRFLNTIINFYLNFNRFFSYYIHDLKIIILIINYLVEINILLLKFLN